MLRLIERTGLRRQQVFAMHADTVERLRNIAKLPELATAYMRREPQATARDFTRYLTAVAESGLREEEVTGAPSAPAVQVMTMHAAKGLEFDHVFVLGLSASRMPGAHRARRDEVPDQLLKERLPAADDRATHEAEMRRLLHVAMTRARKGLVLAWSETGPAGATPRPSPFYEEAREAVDIEEEVLEEELFGPAEGLHSTFRLMRDELLDTVARVGGHLGEMRLDTYLDVDQAVSRYLELIKVAALIERTKEGQTLDTALPELNEILAQCATAEQREILAQSALDSWLRDADRDPSSRPAAAQNGSEPSLDPFIPRRGRGLMLSASDIDTYRICPLKYKFARVFRIPQEPTIHQRFGIALHQVLERFHTAGGGDLPALMELFEASWRRSGFGDSDDELQFRDRAVSALERYWVLDRQSESRAGLVRAQLRVPAGTAPAARTGGPRGSPPGRQLRADRLQDRQGEERPGPARGRAAVALPDGRARVVEARDLGAELLLRDDRREGAGQALGGGARPGEGHGGRDRRRNPQAGVRAHPLGRDLQLLRLPDRLPGGGEVGPRLTAGDDVEIVRTLLAAIDDRRYADAAACLRADAEWHNTRGFPGPTVCRGPDQIASFWEQLFEAYGSSITEIERIEQGDGVVAVLLHAKGSGRSSGVPLDTRWAHSVWILDGLIERVETYGDYERALKAVGLASSQARAGAGSAGSRSRSCRLRAAAPRGSRPPRPRPSRSRGAPRRP